MARMRRTPRSTRPPHRRLEPKREIQLHVVTEGPAKGWIHTHGLAAHGKPELEIRNLPLFLGSAAATLLNDVADYLLNDASTPLLAGQTVDCGTSTFGVVEARPDEDAGYDRAHYEGYVRLSLVDPPEACCECDECAAERARGAALPN